MALLVGRYVNRIDKKGRISVPKPFRDTFREQDFAGLYAYPLFKYPAIEACDEDFMVRIGASLEDLDMFSDDHDDLAAIILENAHPLPFDPEGRIVLPKVLIEHAGLAGEALFVGRGARLAPMRTMKSSSHASNAGAGNGFSGVGMALLVGRYVNRIDKKGRISVPKPFRDTFREQDFAGLYAYPLFKYPAIEACDEDFMVRIGASLEDLDMFSDDHDDLAAIILENAHPRPGVRRSPARWRCKAGRSKSGPAGTPRLPMKEHTKNIKSPEFP